MVFLHLQRQPGPSHSTRLKLDFCQRYLWTLEEIVSRIPDGKRVPLFLECTQPLLSTPLDQSYPKRLDWSAVSQFYLQGAPVEDPLWDQLVAILEPLADLRNAQFKENPLKALTSDGNLFWQYVFETLAPAVRQEKVMPILESQAAEAYILELSARTLVQSAWSTGDPLAIFSCWLRTNYRVVQSRTKRLIAGVNRICEERLRSQELDTIIIADPASAPHLRRGFPDLLPGEPSLPIGFGDICESSLYERLFVDKPDTDSCLTDLKRLLLMSILREHQVLTEADYWLQEFSLLQEVSQMNPVRVDNEIRPYLPKKA